MVVFEKQSGVPRIVYDVTYNNSGYPHFLIYKNGQWLRQSAKYFYPAEVVEN